MSPAREEARQLRHLAPARASARSSVARGRRCPGPGPAAPWARPRSPERRRPSCRPSRRPPGRRRRGRLRSTTEAAMCRLERPAWGRRLPPAGGQDGDRRQRPEPRQHRAQADGQRRGPRPGPGEGRPTRESATRRRGRRGPPGRGPAPRARASASPAFGPRRRPSRRRRGLRGRRPQPPTIPSAADEYRKRTARSVGSERSRRSRLRAATVSPAPSNGPAAAPTRHATPTQVLRSERPAGPAENEAIEAALEISEALQLVADLLDRRDRRAILSHGGILRPLALAASERV